jgi:hypothetical protein
MSINFLSKSKTKKDKTVNLFNMKAFQIFSLIWFNSGAFLVTFPYDLLSNTVPISRNPDTKFSTSVFFHQTIPPRPLIHGLNKAFLNMASYLRSKSTMLVAQRCHWHCCVTCAAESTPLTCTAELLTPLCNQLFRKFSRMILNTTVFYAGKWFGCTRRSGVIDTAVTCTAESLTQLWHASIEKTYISKLPYRLQWFLTFFRFWLYFI